MRIGTSWKQHPVEGPFDAIVIGSGIGGLTTAAMLAKHAGKRVLVLERHYTAGGFTHAFFRPGYEWDVGVHYIGDVGRGRSMRRLFDDITDGALEWADMGDVYDTVVIGDDRYEFVKGRRRWRDRMVSYFPGEEAAIDRYLALVEQAVRSARLYFAEKALPGPIAALAGGLMRRPMLRHARRTVQEVLAEVTTNERLRAVLAAQWGDYGLTPREGSFAIHAMVAHHYFEGAWYPVGGATRIAQTVLPVIERNGGAVRTNADVAEILVEGGRAAGVRMADGRTVRAPIVVSGAGVALTASRLLPPALAERHGFTANLARARPSASHVSLYVGLRHTAEELGLPRTNLWVYPSGDHDGNIARFLADPEGSPLPVAFLSFPSAKDPDFARRHPGRATIEVVSFAPWDWFSRWEQTRSGHRGDDYEALKKSLTDRLLQVLYRMVPQVEGKIDHAELSTPLSTRSFAAHPRGEIYGLAHTPERFAERWLRPRTSIPGLFLTGADVAGCGVAGALMGGVLSASVITRRNLLGAVMKAPSPSPAPNPEKAPDVAAA